MLVNDSKQMSPELVDALRGSFETLIKQVLPEDVAEQRLQAMQSAVIELEQAIIEYNRVAAQSKFSRALTSQTNESLSQAAEKVSEKADKVSYEAATTAGQVFTLITAGISLVGEAGGVLGTLLGIAGATYSVAVALDKARNGTLTAGDLAETFYSVGLAVFGLVKITTPTAWAVSLLASATPYLVQKIIDGEVNQKWKQLFGYINRDPLVLDLNGDGIKTIADTAGIKFDFDGSGNKVGTGWISKEDGILVLDRNGNGKIDNGTELFGDGTVKKDGTYAKDGFDVLRDLDSNHDGIFDANDEDFNNVKVWQDLNQDGIAQVDELKTLKEHGISNIILDSHASGVQTNGNTIVSEGTFTREDGTTGKTGALDLSSNPFYREFGDHIELSETVKKLPDMQGSGAVRDLREAATLSSDLAQILDSYAHLETKEQQLAQVDALISAWAGSSGFTTFDKLIKKMHPGPPEIKTEFCFSWNVPTNSIPTDMYLTDKEKEEKKQKELKQQAMESAIEKLKILEIFNGTNFFSFEVKES